MTELLVLRDRVLDEPELTLEAERRALRVGIADPGNTTAGCASIALSVESVDDMIRHLSAWRDKQRKKEKRNAG